MSVFHIYGADALSNYLWAHKTTHGNSNPISLETRILRCFRVSQQVFPRVTKRISRVVMSALHMYGV